MCPEQSARSNHKLVAATITRVTGVSGRLSSQDSARPGDGSNRCTFVSAVRSAQDNSFRYVGSVGDLTEALPHGDDWLHAHLQQCPERQVGSMPLGKGDPIPVKKILLVGAAIGVAAAGAWLFRAWLPQLVRLAARLSKPFSALRRALRSRPPIPKTPTPRLPDADTNPGALL